MNRRAWHKIFKLAAGMAVAGLAALILLLGLFHSAPFRHFLADYVSDKVYAETGHRLNFGEFHLGMLLQIDASTVKLASETEDWLVMENVKVDWSPYALLCGELIIHTLEIDGVHLINIPHNVAKGGDGTPRPAKPTRRLPLQIETLRIRNCTAGAALPLALPFPIDVKGRAFFDPNTVKLVSDLTFVSTLQPEGVSRWKLGVSQLNDFLIVGTKIEEEGPGPLSRLLEVQGQPSATVKFLGQGTKADWLRLLKGEHTLSDDQIRGDISIRATDFNPHWSWWKRWIGSNIDATSEFALSSDGAIILRELEGTSAKINLAGDADLWPDFGIREGYFNFSFNDPTPIQERFKLPLDGIIAGHLSYRNRRHHQKMDIELCSPHLLWNDKLLEHFKGNFTFDGPWASVKGNMDCHFAYHGVPSSIKADFFVDESTDTLQSPEFTVGFGPHKIKGTGSLGLESRVITADFYANNQSLAGWQELIGHRIEGQLDLTANIRTHLEDGHPIQTLDLAATARNPHFGATKAPAVEVKGQFYDINGQTSGSVKLNTHQLTGDTWTIHQASLNGQLSPDGSWSYRIGTDGQGYHEFDVKVAGDLVRDETGLILALNSMSGKVYRHTFSLDDRAVFHYHEGNALLSPLAFHIGGGNVTADFNWESDSVNAHFGAKNLPLDLFNAAKPITPLSGTLNGTFTIEGDQCNPQANLDLTIQNFRLVEPGFEHASKLNASLKGALENKRLALAFDLHGLGKKPLEISGEMPLALCLKPLKVRVDAKEQPVALDLTGQAYIGSFIHLFVPDTNRFTGAFDANLQVRGTLQEPNMQGTIELMDGEYQSLHTASLLRNIQASIEANGSTLKLTRLTANDSKRGRLKATGEVVLSNKEHYPFTISSKIVKCLLVDKDHLKAVFDGNVELIGNTEGGKLSGELEVVEADMAIPEDTSRKIPSVDLIYINQGSDDPLPTCPTHENSWPLKLDLDLKASGQIFVQGRGLSSEWGGHAKLLGTTEHPLVHGDLNLVRGNFIFIGRSFNIRHGEIHFDGPPTKNTTLSVTAELIADKVEVHADLAGPIKEPILKLTSQPTKPLKEILALLLFEKDLKDISALQGIELAQTLLALTDNGGALDIVGTLRRNIGLDRLAISLSDEDRNDISLQAGKYIAPGVFLSLNKSFRKGADTVSLEMRLSDHIKAEGHVGADSNSKFSLKWKKDY